MQSEVSKMTTEQIFNNPLFKSYLFYCSVLVVKIMFVPLLIGRQRFRKGIFISPEDTALHPKAKVKYDDPDIERVRRAHMNDLENIPLFWVAALAYLCTEPPAWLFLTLCRIFTLARILHTLVYAVVVLPQPARALAFAAGYFSTGFMAISSIAYFW